MFTFSPLTRIASHAVYIVMCFDIVWLWVYRYRGVSIGVIVIFFFLCVFFGCLFVGVVAVVVIGVLVVVLDYFVQCVVVFDRYLFFCFYDFDCFNPYRWSSFSFVCFGYDFCVWVVVIAAKLG